MKRRKDIEIFSRFDELVTLVVHRMQSVTTFKLVKLLYLIEWDYYCAVGARLTDERYIRITFGPVPANYGSIASRLGSHEVEYKEQGTARGFTAKVYKKGPNPRIRTTSFTATELGLIDRALTAYGSLSDDRIKAVAYNTPPMLRYQKVEKARERVIGKRLGGDLFQTFARKKDVDSKAEMRRICIERDRNCKPYNEEDREIDREVMAWLSPLADEARRKMEAGEK